MKQFGIGARISGPRGIRFFLFAGFMLCCASAWSADNPLKSIDLVPESDVFARQGPAVVAQSDFDAHLNRIPEEHRGGFLLSKERIGQVLQNLVLVRLLANEAVEQKLLEDSLVQANLRQTAMVYLADEYRHRFLAERMLDDYSDSARELYLTRPELFKTDTTYSFAHILVWRGRGRGELEAMERIHSVYEQLQDGADFEDLVKAYSDDPTAEENQGKFERVDSEELDEQFAQALAIMQPGQISEPVLTDYGWHIIRLDAEHEGDQPEWEVVEEQAREIARERHQNELIERLYRRLLNVHQIEVSPEAVEVLLSRYGVTDAGRPTTAEVIEQTQEED
jgi:peptidyl-prolyl cis-trans isomerase C